MSHYLLVCACVVASAGAVADVRSRRIPNRLTLTAIAAALLVRMMLGGWVEVKSGVLGILVASGAFFLIFLLQGIGAGDVKLMAAVGAWAGSGYAVQVLVAAMMAGGVLALFYLRRPETSLEAADGIDASRTVSPELNRGMARAQVPFGVAIAIGTLLCGVAGLLRR